MNHEIVPTPKGGKMTTGSSAEATLPAATIDAIVGAYHGDPFSVLGPHDHPEGVVIRAFHPHVQTVDVLLPGDADPVPMRRVREDGFFEAILPNRQLPLSYRFRLSDVEGNRWQQEDVYRFGPTLSDYDEYLMAEGTHIFVYEKLGAHIMNLTPPGDEEAVRGVRFAVWAPNAERVSVVGRFNQWDGRRHPMRRHVDSGIWELFIPGLDQGELYKYEIKSYYQGYVVNKADPVGFFSEMRPKTASIVWDVDRYRWQDDDWMEARAAADHRSSPMSIYEVHLGSWRRKNGWEWLTYRELAEELIPYVKEMGYTHVELMPVAEHPYDASWGYQVTGFYAPTSRFGTPDDFMYFIDQCHQAGIGVILDWVPAHFPKDEAGLGFFDGTHLYEHADPRKGEHPDWGTYIFNYGRNEVRQFLIANALFWLDKYHIDGLRVDAVASMLYLDFSREDDEWVPNRYGGRENLEAIDFIRRFNDRVHELYPGALTIAEESTAWGGVTHDTAQGGLGFDFKWNMGWMHDTLRYISNDPIYRSYHHGTLTFSILYAFSENFILPFSHDEVVHLKRSMLDKMPGDLWQRFANLRALYAYQYAHPGKPLLFMGGEFGQWREWSEARSLDWELLNQDPKHKGLQDLVRDLNDFHRERPAMHRADASFDGFTWLDFRDAEASVIAFARHTSDRSDVVNVVCNFTPVVRRDYRIPSLVSGVYQEVLNSDYEKYGGSGVQNDDRLQTSDEPWQGHPHSLQLTLPPLAVIYLHLKREQETHQSS
ncbi:MAG: 1,4-alpha-glucan branching protein GlgB [Candidatus Promineifilaceae bacterium]|nr:1,4-alpha-glucan branching protein GlgB [Candidatus Promineifilaceae bacterium]